VAVGSSDLEPSLHEAVEFIIGNLDEDGYLAGSEEELAAAFGNTEGEPEKQRRLSCCGAASTWCSSLTRPA